MMEVWDESSMNNNNYADYFDANAKLKYVNMISAFSLERISELCTNLLNAVKRAFIR